MPANWSSCLSVELGVRSHYTWWATFVTKRLVRVMDVLLINVINPIILATTITALAGIVMMY